MRGQYQLDWMIKEIQIAESVIFSVTAAIKCTGWAKSIQTSYFLCYIIFVSSSTSQERKTCDWGEGGRESLTSFISCMACWFSSLVPSLLSMKLMITTVFHGWSLVRGFVIIFTCTFRRNWFVMINRSPLSPL